MSEVPHHLRAGFKVLGELPAPVHVMATVGGPLPVVIAVLENSEIWQVAPTVEPILFTAPPK